MRGSFVHVAGLAMLAGALLACGEQRSAQTPSLSIEPDSFTFARQGVGETSEDEVVVANAGKGDLVIRSFELVDNSTSDEFTLKTRSSAGELSDPPTGLTLAGGEQIVLVVIYAPADEDLRPDTGKVVLETNDATQLTAEIPIGGEDQGAEIVVTPSSIDFGRVNAGDSAEQDLQVSNIGVGRLVIDGMSISGSADFTVLAEGEPVPADLSDAPIEIGADETRLFKIVYAPGAPGPDGGELHIRSNDALSPDTVVPIAANGAAACIRVTPESVDFGASLKVDSMDPATPTPNHRAVLIESCGGTALEVTSIEITGSDAGAFQIADMFDGSGEPGSPLFALPALIPDQVPPSRTLNIDFRPTEERVYGARVILHTNSIPDTTEIVLFGRGVENQCPLPVATAAEYNVRPLDIITLDGTPSSDPGGEVQRWIWTIVSRPEGSTAQIVESFTDPVRPAEGGPADDSATPTAFFFVDLAGQYEFELVVVDDLEQESCDPSASARVTLSAVPDKDLHIQLVWTTPDDPDETDMTGTDLDLHLRHPDADGGWNSDAGQFDCYFANKTPDWGAQLDPADNPTLDIDDTNGAGPENINLAHPEPVTYDVAALYFRAESALGGDDPRQEHISLASLRIYVRGELLGEWLDRELSHRADLWHVASVRWCEDLSVCPEIITVDQVLTEAEYDRP
jgi:hypothetical protein